MYQACCPVANTSILYTAAVVSLTMNSCNRLCYDDCKYACLLNNTEQTCIGCTVAPSRAACDEVNQTAIAFGPVAAPASAIGCVGGSCTFCNNSVVNTLPVNAKVRLKPCNADNTTGSNHTDSIHLHLNEVSWNGIALTSDYPVTLHLDGGGQLQVLNTLRVQAPALLILGATAPCAVHATVFPSTATNINLALPLLVVANRCGVSAAPAPQQHITAEEIVNIEADIPDVQTTLTLAPHVQFIGVAVANLGGNVLVTNSSVRIMIMETIYATVNITVQRQPASGLLNLSAILGVFGTNYEIEYYNNGKLNNIVDPWIRKTMLYLTVSAVLLAGLFLSNGYL